MTWDMPETWDPRPSPLGPDASWRSLIRTATSRRCRKTVESILRQEVERIRAAWGDSNELGEAVGTVRMCPEAACAKYIDGAGRVFQRVGRAPDLVEGMQMAADRLERLLIGRTW